MASTIDNHDDAPNTDAPSDAPAAESVEGVVAAAEAEVSGAVAAEASVNAPIVTPSGMTIDSDGPVYAWAPASEEPQKKRKRRWPWIAIPAAGIVAGLVVASMNLIAPGVSAAGVPVGGLTLSAAEQAITTRVSDARVTMKTDEGSITLTGKDLGASVDATAAADEAFSQAPAWKISTWGAHEVAASITLDDVKTAAALREALPEAFVDPINATLDYDEATGTYTVTPAVAGQGISTDSLRAALEKAVTAEGGEANLEATVEELPAAISTAQAEAGAAKINALSAEAGFYVDDERTVAIDAVTFATWVTTSFDAEGNLVIDADATKIAELTTTLTEKVNRPAVDGVMIVDRQGNQLHDSIFTKEGVEGRTIGDVSSIADEFAKQIEAGDTKYKLTVSKVEPKLEKLERWIEVNLSTQTVYAYENGQVVRSMLTSSGLSPNESATGTFRVNAHVVIQDMGCVPGYDYCTKDVPWPMYYNGDEAFHGTYWHNNFGNPMSHGCMNLTIDNAKWLWDWTPINTEVWVHY